jgi:hypothetical protein
MDNTNETAEPTGASGGSRGLLASAIVAAAVAAAVSFAMNAGGDREMAVARIWWELSDHKAELKIQDWCLDRIWMDGYGKKRPRTYDVGPVYGTLNYADESVGDQRRQ